MRIPQVTGRIRADSVAGAPAQALRARLRKLDADQLRVLVQYERSHAGRADVVAMFERRLAKLAAQ